MAKQQFEEQPPGVAVDSRGGQVVDPTKNVLDLVRAESAKRDELRTADRDLFNTRLDALKDQIKALSDGIALFQNAQRDSETRRIDQLAQTRQEFQNTIRDMLAESVRTTSTLVSTQLVQIQATFDTRVSKLEAGAFTQAGKSSVADPAMAESMARLAGTMNTMVGRLDAIQTTSTQTISRGTGRSDVVAWVVAGIASVVGLLSLLASAGVFHK